MQQTKTFRRLLSWVVCAAMLVVMLPVTAFAEETSGTCGENLTWRLEGDTLTISGTGEMEDYDDWDNTAPWADLAFSKVVTETGVTSIGEYAFYWCTSLTSITIPDSVTSIGDDAFRDCTSLTSITVDTANPAYASAEGVLFNKDKSELIGYPARKSGSYIIPGSVTSIGYSVFSDCTGLTSVTIGNGVTSIEDRAFENCTSLTDITIPDSVTRIGKYAFSGCTSLTSITIPDSVFRIGYDAFAGCHLLTIYGYTGSYAETYAEENNIPFVALQYTPGNVDGTGKVTAVDALLALQIATGKITPTDAQTAAADVNHDNKVDIIDALIILQYAAGKITTFPA